MSKLLVVDDEQAISWGIARVGERMGHEVLTASSAEKALKLIESHRPDAIVLDVRLPGMDGLAAIDEFRRRLGNVPIIVITAYGDLKTAVEAVRQGAFEYIVKPFNAEQIHAAVTRAMEHQVDANLPREDARATGDSQEAVGGLVGRSAAMQHVFTRIALAAASEANVLITGESGTGKELAARAIHRYGSRAAQPLVAVNVASLNPSLAESEIFGHVRGAFTGADASRAGLLAQANGGTLFLDEVADIPLPTQVKLLRALETCEVVPVGSNAPVAADFRLISATHQDLLGMVQRGEFRHDLYFRLCAFRVEMPALRSRKEDIAPLAEHFLRLLAQKSGISPPQMSDECRRELERRDWFGNVRELRNAVEHALVVARSGRLLPEHLPEPIASTTIDPSANDWRRIADMVRDWAEARMNDPEKSDELYNELLTLVEPPLLAEVLARSGGQYVSAARALGLHRTTLKKKLEQYGLDDDS